MYRHRKRRRQLGVPVIALVGYTNAGKSKLNSIYIYICYTIFMYTTVYNRVQYLIIILFSYVT